MTRTNDIIAMAREAGIDHWWESGNEHREVLQQHLERFAALVRADERNKLAAWMIHHNLATGHGDTMEQLCDALGTEIVHRIDMEVESEREACAKVCEGFVHNFEDPSMIEHAAVACANAIRARGTNHG
jgi:hypothetical protein